MQKYWIIIQRVTRARVPLQTPCPSSSTWDLYVYYTIYVYLPAKKKKKLKMQTVGFLSKLASIPDEELFAESTVECTGSYFGKII